VFCIIPTSSFLFGIGAPHIFCVPCAHVCLRASVALLAPGAGPVLFPGILWNAEPSYVCAITESCMMLCFLGPD
jgi:hypothetical protein